MFFFYDNNCHFLWRSICRHCFEKKNEKKTVLFLSLGLNRINNRKEKWGGGGVWGWKDYLLVQYVVYWKHSVVFHHILPVVTTPESSFVRLLLQLMYYKKQNRDFTEPEPPKKRSYRIAKRIKVPLRLL